MAPQWVWGLEAGETEVRWGEVGRDGVIGELV